MHPIELDAILKLAKSKLRGGKIAEAEKMYARVLQQQPRCAQAIHFLGIAAMSRGKLAEAEKLVRRSIEIEPKNADFHNNLATVLGKMGRSVEALGAAQQAIDIKSDFAEAFGNKGVALEQLGRLSEAIECYRRAAELRPDYVEAIGNLGNALSRAGQHDDAVAALKKAVQVRPRVSLAHKNLGNALRRAGRASEAVVAYRMAIEFNPKDADAYNNLGAALQECGKVKEAEEALSTCLSIDPNHRDAHWNRALALLALGRWREGWIEYEWRQHLREDVGQKRNFPQPAWNGSPIEGRTILLLCEQGLGDTIQFIRYAPLLAARGAKVIVECQSKLKPLLQGLCSAAPGPEALSASLRPQSLPSGERRNGMFCSTAAPGCGPVGGNAVTAEGGCPTSSLEGLRRAPFGSEPQGRGQSSRGCSTGIQVISRGEPLPNFDVHARLMTLPCIMGSTPDDLPADVPYLNVAQPPPAVGIGAQMTITAEGGCATFNVGIVWQGSTAHKGDRFRSVSLSMFEPLSRIEGVRLVSLQKGFGAEQIEQNPQMNIVQWMDPQDLTAEALVDTAAMIQQLDLVITVDTSIAHLAGALRVPVWVALPLASDWRWLTERQDSPWYPTMRLYRQRRQGEWADVFERMSEALQEFREPPGLRSSARHCDRSHRRR